MFRKMLANLVVLMVVSVAGFFFGWLPLRVQPGAYCVVTSKTGGIRDKVLEPGQFYWSLAALLPTNVRILEFKPVVREQVLTLEGELPSATLYSEFMAGKPDFSWKLSLRLSAAIRPDFLPALVAGSGVEDETALVAFLDAELSRAAEDLRARLLAALQDPERQELLWSGSIGAELVEQAASARPYLDIREAALVHARLPDLAVYRSARGLYQSYAASFQASVEPALVQASSRAAADQVRLSSLRRYGELLTEFPVLVDYLAIEAGLSPGRQ